MRKVIGDGRHFTLAEASKEKHRGFVGLMLIVLPEPMQPI